MTVQLVPGVFNSEHSSRQRRKHESRKRLRSTLGLPAVGVHGYDLIVFVGIALQQSENVHDLLPLMLMHDTFKRFDYSDQFRGLRVDGIYSTELLLYERARLGPGFSDLSLLAGKYYTRLIPICLPLIVYPGYHEDTKALRPEEDGSIRLAGVSGILRSLIYHLHNSFDAGFIDMSFLDDQLISKLQVVDVPALRHTFREMVTNLYRNECTIKVKLIIDDISVYETSEEYRELVPHCYRAVTRSYRHDHRRPRPNHFGCSGVRIVAQVHDIIPIDHADARGERGKNYRVATTRAPKADRRFFSYHSP